MTYDKESHKEIATASNALFVDIKAIIEQGKRQAYSAINVTVIDMYWKIGQRIVEEEQKGEYRAEYGKALIDNLSEKLSFDYGDGFSFRYLRAFRQFYKTLPDYQIWKSGFPNLTWTHIYRTLMVKDEKAEHQVCKKYETKIIWQRQIT